MKSHNVFVENYKTATAEFNVLGKAFIFLVLLFILVAVVFALVGVFAGMEV